MTESASNRRWLAVLARLAVVKLSKEQGKPLTLSRLAITQRAQTSSGIDLDGPSQILPRVYLGDYWDACNEPQLRSLRVTHIVSILESSPPFAFAEEYRTSLKTLHVPLHDTLTTNIKRHLDTTTEFMQNALEEPDSVVLVHCFQGVSRSATVVAAYLLATSHEFDCAESVLRFLKEKRSIVAPNFSFVGQLDDYAALCLERRSKPAWRQVLKQ